ncbi:MAG: aldo/keto reductase [Actinomycetota bacterium]
MSARAAAMAFPLRFPAVASVVVGMASASEVEDNVAAFETTIPDELWERLEEAS